MITTTISPYSDTCNFSLIPRQIASTFMLIFCHLHPPPQPQFVPRIYQWERNELPPTCGWSQSLLCQGATVGKLLTDWVESIWVFQSAQAPLWKQGFSKCTDTLLKTGLFRVHRHPFENRAFQSAQHPFENRAFQKTQTPLWKQGFFRVHRYPFENKLLTHKVECIWVFESVQISLWADLNDQHLPVWLLTTHICKHVCTQSGQKTKAQQQQQQKVAGGMEIFKKGISCLLDKDAVGLNEVVNGWHEVCCQIWVFPGVSRRDVPFQVCIFPGFRLSLHATKPTRGFLSGSNSCTTTPIPEF